MSNRVGFEHEISTLLYIFTKSQKISQETTMAIRQGFSRIRARKGIGPAG